jgi:GNAT superfamily N-acetyltransferase
MAETNAGRAPGDAGLMIRNAVARDLPVVIVLDERNTGLPKPDYWRDMFERFGTGREGRYFLVAESKGQVVGFIIGEIRAWEFGSPPCGWIFALTVNPDIRLGRIGTQMFNAICGCFKAAGVTKVRTMTSRDDLTVLSFFRSQGMMAGPSIQLELDLDE